VNLTRAAWLAEGCGARVRAAIDGVLAVEQEPERLAPSRWALLDRYVAVPPLVVGSVLDYELRPAGSAADVNSATASQLHRLFRALHLGTAVSDSLTHAVLDWRDADDRASPLGAESRWYEIRQRFPPRNGPLADQAELTRVRGLEALDLSAVLDVEPGRISLQHATLPVLLSLPGLTREVVELVVGRQARARAVGSLQEIAGSVSSASRDSIFAHFATLSQLTTTEPDAWILTCRASSGSPAVTATVEMRLARGGSRASVVRWRSWP